MRLSSVRANVRRWDTWLFSGLLLLPVTRVLFVETTFSDYMAAAYAFACMTLLFVRIQPSAWNNSWSDHAVAFLHAGLPSLPLPAGAEIVPAFVASPVAIASFAFAATAVAELGTSFGAVAERREMVRTGPYRLVRHPIYAGVLLLLAARVVTSASLTALAVVGAFVWLGILRLTREESVMLADPSYHEYTRRVRWKLIPLVY